MGAWAEAETSDVESHRPVPKFLATAAHSMSDNLFYHKHDSGSANQDEFEKYRSNPGQVLGCCLSVLLCNLWVPLLCITAAGGVDSACEHNIGLTLTVYWMVAYITSPLVMAMKLMGAAANSKSFFRVGSYVFASTGCFALFMTIFMLVQYGSTTDDLCYDDSGSINPRTVLIVIPIIVLSIFGIGILLVSCVICLFFPMMLFGYQTMESPKARQTTLSFANPPAQQTEPGS